MKNNMKIIRKNVFETNSSSTHSISISKLNDYILPKEINFTFGEFGWEFSKYTSSFDKASYFKIFKSNQSACAHEIPFPPSS